MTTRYYRLLEPCTFYDGPSNDEKHQRIFPAGTIVLQVDRLHLVRAEPEWILWNVCTARRSLLSPLELLAMEAP